MTAAALSSFSFAGGDIAPIVAAPILIEDDNSAFYVGIGLASLRSYATDSDWFEEETPTQDVTGAVSFLAGYEYNQYVAFEGRISTSFTDEDYAEITTYSIFVKPQYPVSEEFNIYGLLGFGNVSVDGTNGDMPGHAQNAGVSIMDETSFQWGIGASYEVMENIAIFIDYTSLISDGEINSQLYRYDNTYYSELSSDAWTLGVTYKF